MESGHGCERAPRLCSVKVLAHFARASLGFRATLVVMCALTMTACGAASIQVNSSSRSEAMPKSVRSLSASVSGTRTVGIAKGFDASKVLTTATGSEVVVVGSVRCGTASCTAIATRSLGPTSASGAWSSVTLHGLGFKRSRGITVISDYRFANRRDGFALFTRYGHTLITSRLYLTTNGGTHWRAVELAHRQFIDAAFTTHSLVGLAGKCSAHGGAQACTSYELMRLPLVTGRPQVNPLLTPNLPYPFLEQPSLAAQGSTVVVVTNPTGPRTAYPLMFESQGGVPPFVKSVRKSLVAVTACGLAIRRPAIWAMCPGGMNISELHAPSLTGRFTQFWDPSGTIGDAFAPVNAVDAYRIVVNPRENGSTLQLTTDAGAHFHTVAAITSPEFSLGATSISFVSLRTGFLATEQFVKGHFHPLLWRTTDGGTTWTRVFPPA